MFDANKGSNGARGLLRQWSVLAVFLASLSFQAVVVFAQDPPPSSSSSPPPSSSGTLLPVPTGGSTWDPKQGEEFLKLVPGYTYNLTSESQQTRTSICDQNVQYCKIAGCQDPKANIKTNFCNPEKMGWNCECDGDGDQGKAIRLTDWQVPLNQFDCKMRSLACSQACQDPNATPKVNSTADCSSACNYVYGVTCGTSLQPIPEYKVSKEGDTPKYFQETSKGQGGGSRSPSSSAQQTLSSPGLKVMLMVSLVVIGSTSFITLGDGMMMMGP